MNLSIITPCFNSAQWIRQCVASVARQVREECLHDTGSTEGVRNYDLGVRGTGEEVRESDRLNPASLKHKTSEIEAISVHHHIQDGGSSDGTRELLAEYQANSSKLKVNDYSFSFVSEVDSGMYNALNKAFAATDGEVIGHLNADEQYLPGTLQFVVDYFEAHPKVDVLFGAVVVNDADGNYICSRMPMKPQLLHTQVCHLCTFTASMFFRRSAIEKLGNYFDESFKTAGDADLICRMLRAKLKMATVRRYFSVFADTGDNLALSEKAKAEQLRLAKKAPVWASKAARFVELLHRIRKLICGAYCLKPFEYSFVLKDGSVSLKKVQTPSGRWKSRL